MRTPEQTTPAIDCTVVDTVRCLESFGNWTEVELILFCQCDIRFVIELMCFLVFSFLSICLHSIFILNFSDDKTNTNYGKIDWSIM